MNIYACYEISKGRQKHKFILCANTIEKVEELAAKNVKFNRKYIIKEVGKKCIISF